MLVRAPHGGPTLFMPSGLLRTGALLLLFRRLYRVRNAISRFETSEVDSSGEPGRSANPGLSQRFAELSNDACCSSIQGAGVAATGAGVGTSVQASTGDEAGARPFLSAQRRSSSCCRRMSLSKSRVDQLPPNLRAVTATAVAIHLRQKIPRKKSSSFSTSVKSTHEAKSRFLGNSLQWVWSPLRFIHVGGLKNRGAARLRRETWPTPLTSLRATR